MSEIPNWVLWTGLGAAACLALAMTVAHLGHLADHRDLTIGSERLRKILERIGYGKHK
jgi:hypothetical protein